MDSKKKNMIEILVDASVSCFSIGFTDKVKMSDGDSSYINLYDEHNGCFYRNLNSILYCLGDGILKLSYGTNLSLMDSNLFVDNICNYKFLSMLSNNHYNSSGTIPSESVHSCSLHNPKLEFAELINSDCKCGDTITDKNFWNYLCNDEDGYEVVFTQLEKSLANWRIA